MIKWRMTKIQSDNNRNISKDLLHHFIFEESAATSKPMPIRGNLVHLNETFSNAMQHQHLPKTIKIALGELMAASALLSATLKMDGEMVLQLQSKGALKLLVVECTSDLKMRATAKWDETQTDEMRNQTFIELVKDGHFVITLDPREGEAYQGIVPIEGETIAQMLTNYMLRSQQIDTNIWLQCDGESASGLLLQKLPNMAENDQDAWNRINQLADTVTPIELQSLVAETLLTRLFAEEHVRLFAPKATHFYCRCNQNKVADMLKILGETEVNEILSEHGSVDVNCDFCNKHYAFDAVDISQLFNEKAALTSSKSTH
jgi:molecular chaperone Hsp33